jgi:hypothetical protein
MLVRPDGVLADGDETPAVCIDRFAEISADSVRSMGVIYDLKRLLETKPYTCLWIDEYRANHDDDGTLDEETLQSVKQFINSLDPRTKGTTFGVSALLHEFYSLRRDMWLDDQTVIGRGLHIQAGSGTNFHFTVAHEAR